MLPKLKGYHKPKSIAEALALLEKNSGTILVISGGSKLNAAPNRTVEELVDITGLDLDYILIEQGVTRIGATTRLQTILASPKIQTLGNGILAEAVLLNSPSRMIRNAATIGGELISTCQLSPLYGALLAMQAQVRIVGGDEFALPMNIFLNKKGLAGGLLIEVVIPKMPSQTYAALASIPGPARRPPILCCCARVSINRGRFRDVKITLTGTEPVPQRQHSAELSLEDKPLTNANMAAAADLVYQEFRPIADELSSYEYRHEVSPILVKRALSKCLELAEEGFLTK